jgi:hypothetical protein
LIDWNGIRCKKIQCEHYLATQFTLAMLTLPYWRWVVAVIPQTTKTKTELWSLPRDSNSSGLCATARPIIFDRRGKQLEVNSLNTDGTSNTTEATLMFNFVHLHFISAGLFNTVKCNK